MKHKLFYFVLSFVFILSLGITLQSATGSCANKKMKLNVKKLTLTKNETYTIRVYNLKKKYTVKFSTDNDNVVSIKTIKTNKQASKTAIVTAVNSGVAQVRASIYNRKSKLVRTLKTNIRVTPSAVSIKFSVPKVQLEISDTLKLPVLIKPNISQETPVFESSDPDIVTVNSKGIITAISPGHATITATLLSSGQKASCNVHVLPCPPDEYDPDFDE